MDYKNGCANNSKAKMYFVRHMCVVEAVKVAKRAKLGEKRNVKNTKL